MVGCPGTYTAILTGRHTDVREAMVEVLRNAGLFPDQLILKPRAGASCRNRGSSGVRRSLTATTPTHQPTHLRRVR